ncbi:Predicted dehydrogenase [Paenibacillus sp. UNCCL117]|uniref:Gfo/Idh/MocA family protein n=1 Tax=unclassified Paenibacillus TaxID=185978 RepID=UPI000884C208|nr:MULTISPECIES: Gfo/Idh/MocA family oxidoreductase [unclassified Paenibacillus]SDE64591.1 Predicted dehydrogenase [Paenibacillus sp. cl123]SFW70547.1 Predicted dehydrogenase [Paenibacillus sp. UNCCL117]
MEAIKVGIAGTGFSAMAHLEALRRIPGVKVCGIAASSLEKGEKVAKEMNIPKAYASWEELVQDPEIQAIHNCTPNVLHYKINRAVLEAGKHLLSEKPLAVDSGQSAELIRLAAESEAVSGVCFNYRHYPMVSQMKEMLQTGEPGRVHHVIGGYMQDWLLFDTDYSWRLDTDMNGPSRAVADIGSHWCDTVQHVLNKRITQVMADLQTVHPVRYRPKGSVETFAGSGGQKDTEPFAVSTEDYGSVLIHLEDGVRGVFTVSQVAAGRKNRLSLEISAEFSSMAWDQENPNTLWVGKRETASEDWSTDPALLLPKSAAMTHYPGGHQEGWPDGLKNLFIDFYAKVEDRSRKSSFATLEDGHRIVKLVEAILRSHREQRWVRVEE